MGQQAAAGARTVFTPGQRLALFIALAALMILRLPAAWTHGRFLDEEATVFLAYAWHRPWWEALLRPFAGYLNLGATASTTLLAALVKGGVVSLERAPYVTMAIALATQLVPAILLLTGRAAFLASRPAVVAALLFLAVMPATEEVFYNVLHIQFHLALAAAIVLALDPPTGRVARIGYPLLLVLAPLCGPGAIVILPLFALRALIDRDPRRAIQVAAFATGAAGQLLLFYASNPARGQLVDPLSLVAVMTVRLLVLPVLGFHQAFLIGMGIHHSQLDGGHRWLLPTLIGAALFVGLVVAALRRRDAAIWLVLAALAVGLASFGYGMIVRHRLDLFSIGAGERYNFVPLTLIALAAVVLAARRQGRGRYVWRLLCVVALVHGAIRFHSPLPDYADGPVWPAQVAAWRLDHRHPLTVWPSPYAADLSDRFHPCTPIGKDPTRSSDPRYCDSSWVAGLMRIHD